MTTPNSQADGDDRSRGRTGLLALGALGIVYGDIGTSPIYAFREAVGVNGGADESSVLGIASLVVWTLVLVVAVKYLWVVMRADDHGEGGIIALEALATRGSSRGRGVVHVLGATGLFGTALLYGDGMITPAISVLSAVEGIEVVAPDLGGLVLPIAVAILTGLFAVQRRGTARIGAAFGPVMLVWFGYLAVTGVLQVVQQPSVLRALSPTWGIGFLFSGGLRPLFVLGTVFLVATGAEALYADMGHFGRTPITLSWSVLVMPALLLQYLGQAALLLRDAGAGEQVFYRMVPDALVPLAVALATMATVIASQALISGAFSLTGQAVQLGYLPRLEVDHTSEREVGQVYVPAVNWALYVLAVALTIGFGSSTRLADAYGVAVVLTMVITTVLFYVVAVDRLGWTATRARAVCAGFLVVDLAFLAANVDKVPSGGWFPLVVGAVLFLLMSTWRRGNELIEAATQPEKVGLQRFIRQIAEDGVTRVPGTAVHMTRRRGVVPMTVRTDLRHHDVLHEQVVLVTVVTARSARVPTARRSEVRHHDAGFVTILLRFGFVEEPDVVEALGTLANGFTLDLDDTVFVLGTEQVRPTRGDGMAPWRERLFVAMRRNARDPTSTFRLPSDRVMTLGRHVDI